MKPSSRLWNSARSYREKFKRFQERTIIDKFEATLKPNEIEYLNNNWLVWGRENQFPHNEHWRIWILLGGRGAGKTRAGAEWLRAKVNARGKRNNCGGRIALVGETYNDVRDTMIEGQSGLLAVHSNLERPKWLSSQRKLIWPNGVIGQVFSSNDPDGLRGAQFGAAWCNELCKWQNLEATWDMLQFCMRLGNNPQQVVTTTPKPSPFLKKLMGQDGVMIERSSTMENVDNLADGFVAHMNELYSGTRLGRQELNAEILEDREDALWNRAQLEALRADPALPLKRIVIAVDPPATSGKNSAACGIVAVAHDANGKCYVISDNTMKKASPLAWANKVVNLYHELEADIVIAETNQGGEMVAAVVHGVDESIPIRNAHARQGKWTRAEPVALLYERGKVHHAGIFTELEDQMCNFSSDGKSDGISPDRVDALVWALTELELKRKTAPRIRPI